MSIATIDTQPGIFHALREANVARQDTWCPDQKPDLSFRGNELAGEVGEVCNTIKKLERERLGWLGSRDTVQHLAEEVADVVICADLVAITAGFSLEAAIVAKFNFTSVNNGLPQRLSLISQAACDVLAERRRQVGSEGFSSGHDDDHERGELADAAACYAANAAGNVSWTDCPPSYWPWAAEWWKPRSKREDLVRAGALILAEIERLDREEALEAGR